MSEPQPDGSVHALTLIAFVGSVFSPYYAWARRRHGDSGAPAEAHCAINLSLYRRPAGATTFDRLWAMTERGGSQVRRDSQQLQIGPSRLTWTSNGSLQIDIDEWTVPWPRRLRGRILLRPHILPGEAFALDAASRHVWQPVCPSGRIELDFDAPRLQWQGGAYLDANHGTRPLEHDFTSWQWSRSALPGTRSRVHYEVEPTQGGSRALALDIDANGHLETLPLPALHALPDTAWRLARNCRADRPPKLLATLESGPFYSRSLLRDPTDGTVSVHESLSLQRFVQPWVQALLPFRMPRRPDWTRSR